MGDWGRYLEKVAADVLAGGFAEGKTDTDFDPKQLEMGQKVEMEHTHEPRVAREITRDHLEEIPDYYTRLDNMEEEARDDGKLHDVEKKAFGVGPEVPVPVELMSTAGGLYAGHGMGKSLAGQTAASVAPRGKILRTEEKARRAAVFTAPLAGLAALALARKYGLANRAASLLAKKAPTGLIANPQLEQEAVRMATPFVAGLGGSAVGGLGTGAAFGAASHLTPNPSKEKKAFIPIGGVAGYLSQGNPDATPRSGFWRGAGGGILGDAVGRVPGYLMHKPMLAEAGGAVGEVAGGILGGLTARPSLVEKKVYERKLMSETKPKSKEKKSSISQATLDRVLGALYLEYGPTLQKHAALQFYTTRDKPRLDREALGAPFCKLAQASGLDPWLMASHIVKAFPKLEKIASSKPSHAQELASFYMGWAGEMTKKADLVGGLARVGGALKGGLKGIAQGARGGAAEARAVEQAGGGSYMRGRELIKADPELLSITKHPPMHPGRPPEVPGGGAPLAASTPSTAAPAKKPSGLADQLRGAGILGAFGFGGAATMGAFDQPSYGDAYAY